MIMQYSSIALLICVCPSVHFLRKNPRAARREEMSRKLPRGDKTNADEISCLFVVVCTEMYLSCCFFASFLQNRCQNPIGTMIMPIKDLLLFRALICYPILISSNRKLGDWQEYIYMRMSLIQFSPKEELSVLSHGPIKSNAT